MSCQLSPGYETSGRLGDVGKRPTMSAVRAWNRTPRSRRRAAARRGVVEAEQQRADQLALTLLVPAKAGDHAVRGAEVLHLHPERPT
jgi:hypothetical protein